MNNKVDIEKIKVATLLCNNGFTKEAALWNANRYVEYKRGQKRNALVKIAVAKHLLSKGVNPKLVSKQVVPFINYMKQTEGFDKQASWNEVWGGIKNMWNKNPKLQNAVKYGVAGFVPGFAASAISGKGNPFLTGLGSGLAGSAVGGLWGDKIIPWGEQKWNDMGKWRKNTFQPWMNSMFVTKGAKK
jgi:hypothetical protein